MAAVEEGPALIIGISFATLLQLEIAAVHQDDVDVRPGIDIHRERQRAVGGHIYGQVNALAVADDLGPGSGEIGRDLTDSDCYQ